MAEPTGAPPSAPRPRGGGMMASAGSQTVKGAALVVCAILVGWVLLNVVDDGDTSGTSASKTTATTAKGGTSKSSTTTAAKAGKTPDQVAIIVLNGGAPPGSAGTMSDRLEQAGYTNQATPADDDNQTRKGNFVFCQKGFAGEMEALATAVGADTISSDATGLNDIPVRFSAGRDCVVIVGGVRT